ncbi:hypothetical protein D3C87_1854920 [compost metagenome]
MPLLIKSRDGRIINTNMGKEQGIRLMLRETSIILMAILPMEQVLVEPAVPGDLLLPDRISINMIRHFRVSQQTGFHGLLIEITEKISGTPE